MRGVTGRREHLDRVHGARWLYWKGSNVAVSVFFPLVLGPYGAVNPDADDEDDFQADGSGATAARAGFQTLDRWRDALAVHNVFLSQARVRKSAVSPQLRDPPPKQGVADHLLSEQIAADARCCSSA